MPQPYGGKSVLSIFRADMESAPTGVANDIILGRSKPPPYGVLYLCHSGGLLRGAALLRAVGDACPYDGCEGVLRFFRADMESAPTGYKPLF